MGLISFIGEKLFGGNRLFNNYILGQKGSIWIDTSKPRQLYDEIPQLQTVINKDCSMFSNMDLWHVNKEGERIENSPIEALLHQPNVMQSMNEFLYQYMLQYNLYGNAFTYKNQASKLKPPVALWNVSACYMQPISTGKVFEQTKKDEIISGYEYKESGRTRTFKTEEILWTKRNDPDNPIVGCSLIHSLKFPLSNAKAAYEYRNVILTEKGAIGILSNESRDSMGAMPLKPDEKKKIEQQYRGDYGVSEGQARILITEASLKWQPMTYPTKDLLLFEEVDAAMITIADAFGHNINIYSSKNATFENVKNSIIQTYQDAIFPKADAFSQAVSKFLNLPNGERLIANYDHLEIMKENRQRGMAGLQQLVTMLSQAVENNLIDSNTARSVLVNELGVQS
jgi:HK97 family phage portal protein